MVVDTANTHDPRLAPYERLLAETKSVRGVSLWQDAWSRLRKNVVAVTALVYLAVVALLAALTPLWPLQSPYRIAPQRVLQAPVALEIVEHGIDVLDENGRFDPGRRATEFQELSWFNQWLLKLRLKLWGQRALSSVCGTDELGRDVLARLFWGARVSLLAGLAATAVSLIVGVSYGAIAGFAGGWIDELMMRFVDVIDSLPLIFVVIFLLTFLSAETVRATLESVGVNRMMIFFLVVGMIYWLTMARVVRGQVLSLKNEQFVDAARVIGASRFRIIFLHLVPNVLGVVVVYLTLTIPQVMLFEAFLSFLGLGVQAPDVSWGVMANQGFNVITPIKTFGWLIVYPSIAIGATLLALNFLGDGLRDALDPRMKNR